MIRRWRSTLIFLKQKKDDMNTLWRDTKKMILTKYRLSAYTKGTISQVERQVQIQMKRQLQRSLRVDVTCFERAAWQDCRRRSKKLSEYCIKKVKGDQVRSWKADWIQKLSQPVEGWRKQSQIYWIRRWSKRSFGDLHYIAWRKGDKETCGKQNTKYRRNSKKFQSPISWKFDSSYLKTNVERE